MRVGAGGGGARGPPKQRWCRVTQLALACESARADEPPRGAASGWADCPDAAQGGARLL